MHGRQKVERSAEDALAKEKERSQKLKAYQYALKIIFEKRAADKLDAELLPIIAQVLCANPDVATLWNIRREVLLRLKDSEESNFDDLVTKELTLTEGCLQSNPKSYGTWHQRCWLMKETNFERVPEEVKLCEKYLAADERNFHCWDYRRYLLDNSSSVTLEQELEFTTKQIVKNFSNYSSWHLRSTILPRLSKDFLRDELEVVKNAAFTDPSDQSVWLYHRWLLISHLPQDNVEAKSQQRGQFKELKSSDLDQILQGELEWVRELNDEEPENKWIVMTLVLLMRLINFKKFRPEIEDCLNKVTKVDPGRSNYYSHLRSKYTKEWST